MVQTCLFRIRPELKTPGTAICGVQSGGRPVRVFYAFDPRRSAILLIGGDKTGNDRFYDEMIPVADKLYDVYIDEIRKEGLIK